MRQLPPSRLERTTTRGTPPKLLLLGWGFSLPGRLVGVDTRETLIGVPRSSLLLARVGSHVCRYHPSLTPCLITSSPASAMPVQTVPSKLVFKSFPASKAFISLAINRLRQPHASFPGQQCERIICEHRM